MVDYISYDGKRFPVQLATLAIKDFEQETKLGWMDIGEDLRIHSILLWYGIKTGYEKLDKPFFKIKKKKVDGKTVEEEIPIVTRKECLWILDEAFEQYSDIFIRALARMTGHSEDELKSKAQDELKAKKK